MTKPGYIIWTREQDDWEKDQHLFTTREQDQVIRLPCLCTEAIPWENAAPPCQRLIVTSAKTLTYARHIPELWNLFKSVPIWTFGDQTFARGEQMGLNMQQVPAENGKIFFHELLQLWGTTKNLPTLYAGPREPAFPLSDKLKDEGFAISHLALYQTVTGVFTPTGIELTASQKNNLLPKLHGVICFASPSAVEGFLKGFEHDAPAALKNLHAVAMGSTTAAACGKFSDLTKAKAPTMAALVAAARGILGPY